MRRQREIAAIEHEIAFDGIDSVRTQHRHERLPLLNRDLGIAVAFEDQIAL
jgi:hypothetical protein